MNPYKILLTMEQRKFISDMSGPVMQNALSNLVSLFHESVSSITATSCKTRWISGKNHSPQNKAKHVRNSSSVSSMRSKAISLTITFSRNICVPELILLVQC